MEKIWILSDSGNAIALKHQKDMIYREDIKIEMMLKEERLGIDLKNINSLEIIAPYKFKNKVFIKYIITLIIGITIGSILQLDPLISAIVLLTFGFNSLLFQINFNLPHQLIRLTDKDNKNICIVVKVEDLENLCNIIGAVIELEKLKPEKFNDVEKKQIDLKKYGLVTIISSISLLLIVKIMKSSQHNNELYYNIFTYSAAIATGIICLLGCYKVVYNTYKLHKIKG